MTASETTTLVLAALAVVAGAAVAVGMWHRSRRRHRAVRSRHPSVRPPVAVGLAAGVDGPSLRIEVLRGAPTLSIDIVSYRTVEPDGEWDSLAIVEPIVVAPGAATALPVAVPAGVTSADVVVAWTAHHASGDVPASRLFRVPPERATATPPPRSGTLGPAPALALLVVLALALAVVVRSAVLERDTAAGTPVTSLPAAAGSVAPEPTHPPTDSAAVPDVTTGPAPTSPPATSPSTSSPSTSSPSTSSPSTSSPSTSTSVASPSTTDAVVSPSVTADGPQVVATARTEPCRFGDDCLVVGFRLDGFASAPEQYVCEFDDGTRFTFNFDSGGVETACATGRAGAAITVEVDGVRSETVTRPATNP